MYEFIKAFPHQFLFEPVIQNKEHWKQYERFVVIGMGGSHLAADILDGHKPLLEITVHQDYGLPELPEHFLRHTLFIASSYSGNTEETIDALKEAIRRNLPAAALCTGGILLEIAKKNNIPYIQLPSSNVLHHAITGWVLMGLLEFMGQKEMQREARELAARLHPEALEERGKNIAASLQGKVPILYSSRHNRFLSFQWKIKINETTKIPCFANQLPEFNHNEMQGFDVIDSTRALSERFSFVFLRDPEDRPRIQERVDVSAAMLKEKSFAVHIIDAEGETKLERIFSSLILADWVAYYLALFYKQNPSEVPMVRDFKSRLKTT
ncbi:MAG: hypothetical protein HY458_00505 [Parcubacteria group bacterium]|nr:hypothetical protein [Parcubacteria group bacterium]